MALAPKSRTLSDDSPAKKFVDACNVGQRRKDVDLNPVGVVGRLQGYQCRKLLVI